MPVFTDQLGRDVSIVDQPSRIVSTVPSQTELLAHLHLKQEVIGITKFCVHPREWFHSKIRIGGTKQLNIELIKELHPHLVIANKEENQKEQIEALAAHLPVWVSDVHDLASAFDMMLQVGAITGRKAEAENLVDEIKRRFKRFQPKHLTKPKTAYLIWRNPYMTVGGDTFIHQMLCYAGFDNIFAAEKRYPVIDLYMLREKACEWLLLSSEPYPFQQKHIDEIQEHLPKTKIVLVDGEMFSWYGSRLLYAPQYIHDLRQ